MYICTYQGLSNYTELHGQILGMSWLKDWVNGIYLNVVQGDALSLDYLTCAKTMDLFVSYCDQFKTYLRKLFRFCLLRYHIAVSEVFLHYKFVDSLLLRLVHTGVSDSSISVYR